MTLPIAENCIKIRQQFGNFKYQSEQTAEATSLSDCLKITFASKWNYKEEVMKFIFVTLLNLGEWHHQRFSCLVFLSWLVTPIKLSKIK